MECIKYATKNFPGEQHYYSSLLTSTPLLSKEYYRHATHFETNGRVTMHAISKLKKQYLLKVAQQ